MPSPGTHLHDRLARRWYLTALGLIGTVALGVLAASLAPVGYRAHATLLLVPPVNFAATGSRLHSMGDLEPFAETVGTVIDGRRNDAELRARGLVGTYTVAHELNTAEPILVATADASSPQAAIANVNLIVGTASPALTELQRPNLVSRSDRITVQVVSRPSKAESYIKSRWVERGLVLAAVLLGLIATALVVSVVDGLLLRRRRGTAEA
jgi:hypothetical protein